MKAFTTLAAAAALCASSVSGEVIKSCPTDNVCFSLGIPASSASANSGNIYFQIQAPTSYSWVALGQGSRMANSNIFVLYQDGKGNVTISPRRGTGHSMPAFESATKLQLLAGSGVSGGMMTANVRCSNCQSWNGGTMALNSKQSNWIAAWKGGSALNSASTSANIAQHDDNTGFRIDLTTAQIASDANPFTGASGGSGSGGSGNGSGSGNSGSGNSGGIVAVGGGSPSNTQLLAHGIIMAVVWVIMYPVGAMLMPLIGKWFIHAGWQFLAFLLMWVGFALGVLVAQEYDILFKQTHTILGTVVICAMVLQPALGMAHHNYYKRNQQRGLISYAHIFYGRALIIIGIVNGGLGLELAKAPRAFTIAYSVIAAVVTLAYLSAAALGAVRSSRRQKEDSQYQSDSPRQPYRQQFQ